MKEGHPRQVLEEGEIWQRDLRQGASLATEKLPGSWQGGSPPASHLHPTGRLLVTPGQSRVEMLPSGESTIGSALAAAPQLCQSPHFSSP